MCAVVGFHAPVLEMPQLLQPPRAEGQLLGVPACQQESGGGGLLFVAADLFVLQTGAHSAGALALASTQARSTSSDERRGILLQLLRTESRYHRFSYRRFSGELSLIETYN